MITTIVAIMKTSRFCSSALMGATLAVGCCFSLSACAEQTHREEVLLSMERIGPQAMELVVRNERQEPMRLPADIVNGPRATKDSVFLVVQDFNGVAIDRCAIVEIEPEKMHDVVIPPGESVAFAVPLRTLEATYCRPGLVHAAYGSLTADDHVIAKATSNVVRVEPIEP